MAQFAALLFLHASVFFVAAAAEHSDHHLIEATNSGLTLLRNHDQLDELKDELDDGGFGIAGFFAGDPDSNPAYKRFLSMSRDRFWLEPGERLRHG